MYLNDGIGRKHIGLAAKNKMSGHIGFRHLEKCQNPNKWVPIAIQNRFACQNWISTAGDLRKT
jgi:hypothetical protein